MQLFPAENIQINQKKVDRIETILKSVLRLVIYSRFHMADDILNDYLDGITDLKQLVAIKNAQMEAQDEAEVVEYLKDLQLSLEFIAEEINDHNDFEKEIQLFQLLRIISPATNAKHPNKYRQTEVMVGGHACPEPSRVPGLMSQLFYQISTISNPIVRSIYLHHEMIRIHPFADGNGRVARIAKNWILMFGLYPPIFIDDVTQKKEYIKALSQSFKTLDQKPGVWNDNIHLFFEQQMDILLETVSNLLVHIDKLGQTRFKKS